MTKQPVARTRDGARPATEPGSARDPVGAHGVRPVADRPAPHPAADVQAPNQTIPSAPDVAAIAARVPATPPGIPDHRDEIAAAVATIVQRFHPKRVILYGSRARGTPRPDSDADLMVIADPPPQRGEVADAVLRRPRRVRPGVQVRTPAQIRVGLEEGDFFVLDVMTEGIILYDVDGSETVMGNGTSGAGGDSAGRRGPQQTTLNWVRKAEADLRLARRAVEPPDPLWDGVCFHAQQSVEKYLKAYLQEHGIRSPRTHELHTLADLIGSRIPNLVQLRSDLDWLSDYAVDIRYPDTVASQAEAARALNLATDVRAMLRLALGL